MSDSGYIYINCNGTLTWGHIDPVSAGYEAAGAQPADGPPMSDADLRAAIVKLGREAVARKRGADVASAITALHAQHTTNGRPSRFLPEA